MLDMGIIKVEVNFAELREAFKVARERTKILDHLARDLKGAATKMIMLARPVLVMNLRS